jgi:hypothetical protein
MHPRPASSAPGVQKKAPQKMRGYQSLAEREGFEPSVMLPPRLISSQVHSTTLPPLLHSTLRLVTAANSISGL